MGVLLLLGLAFFPAPARAAEVPTPDATGSYVVCGIDTSTREVQPSPYLEQVFIKFACNYSGTSVPTRITFIRSFADNGGTVYNNVSEAFNFSNNGVACGGAGYTGTIQYTVEHSLKRMSGSFCTAQSGTLVSVDDLTFTAGSAKAGRIEFQTQNGTIPPFPVDYYAGGQAGEGGPPTDGCISIQYWPLPLPGVSDGVAGSLQLGSLIDMYATWEGTIEQLRYRWTSTESYRNIGLGSYPVSPHAPASSMYNFQLQTPVIPSTIENLSIECTDEYGVTKGQVSADGSMVWGDPASEDVSPCDVLIATGFDLTAGAYDAGQSVLVTVTFTSRPNSIGEAIVPYSVAHGALEAGPFDYVYDQATGSPSKGVGGIAVRVTADGTGTLPAEWWVRCVNTVGGTPQVSSLWDMVKEGIESIGRRDCAGEASVGLKPSSWVPGILRGFVCLLVPRADFMTFTANDLERSFKGSVLNTPVALVSSLISAGQTFMGAADTGLAGCSGPEFTLPLGADPQPIQPLNACPGAPMEDFADLSKVVSGAALVIGAVWTLIELFGGPSKKPLIDEKTQQTRMF